MEPIKNPQAGGSYVRDPKTGELTRVEDSQTASPADISSEQQTGAAAAPPSKARGVFAKHLTDGKE